MSHFSIRCRNCEKKLEDVYCAFCEHCKDALLITEPARLIAAIQYCSISPAEGRRG